MIEFDDNLRCVWFMSAPDRSFDILGAVHRTPNGPTTLTYRFAHYDPGYEKVDPWKDDDHTKKNWYRFQTKGDSDEAFRRMHDDFDNMVGFVASQLKAEKHRLWRQLDEPLDDYMKRFTAQSFVSVGKKVK